MAELKTRPNKKSVREFVKGIEDKDRQNLTNYLASGFVGYDDLLARLGRHSTGKACLYVKRLDQVGEEVLTELLRRSVDVRDVGAEAGGLPRMSEMPSPSR